MSKVFRPSNRETRLLSKIESSRERFRRKAIQSIMDCIDPLSNSVAMKLVENNLVETTNKNALEEQIYKALELMTHSDDFEVDYQTAPFRNVVKNPHIVSLYLTAFIIEKVINHHDVIDIYGSDEEIYYCINREVVKHIPE